MDDVLTSLEELRDTIQKIDEFVEGEMRRMSDEIIRRKVEEDAYMEKVLNSIFLSVD